MDAVLWTYIYLKGVAFGLVCACLLTIPYAASLQPGEGIPGRYVGYAILAVVLGYVGGLWLFV